LNEYSFVNFFTIYCILNSYIIIKRTIVNITIKVVISFKSVVWSSGFFNKILIINLNKILF
jgi:hypothetical protein